jgi:hypothetical protein
MSTPSWVRRVGVAMVAVGSVELVAPAARGAQLPNPTITAWADPFPGPYGSRPSIGCATCR